MTILASVNNKTVMPGITPIADVPDRPTIGTATAAGLAASVTFTAATTGGTATTFTATSTPGSLTGTSATSPITVSGLTGDTSYTFTVRANNSTGSSANSAASNSITAVSPISGGYDSLATVIVPSGGLSTITFAGIPSGYKHLQIRALARSDRNVSDGDFYSLRFNSDSGANYIAGHQLYGNGTSVTSYFNGASSNQIYIERIPALNSTASVFGGMVLDILDYQNSSKNKTTRALLGFDNNSASPVGQIHFASGAWMSTSSITSMTFTSGTSSNFVANSQFALYGVK